MGKITFTDHPVIREKPDQYITVIVQPETVIKSYRLSLFSFEWLDGQGNIKSPDSLPPAEKEKYEQARKFLQDGKALEKPILGIGLQDNVEFGQGRPEFMTAAILGAKEIPVHIRRSNKEDFKPFIAEIE